MYGYRDPNMMLQANACVRAGSFAWRWVFLTVLERCPCNWQRQCARTSNRWRYSLDVSHPPRLVGSSLRERRRFNCVCFKSDVMIANRSWRWKGLICRREGSARPAKNGNTLTRFVISVHHIVYLCGAYKSDNFPSSIRHPFWLIWFKKTTIGGIRVVDTSASRIVADGELVMTADGQIRVGHYFLLLYRLHATDVVMQHLASLISFGP